MKLKLIYFSLFSLSTLFYLIPGTTKIANAACVGLDVANQLALTGSKEPSTQENNVDLNASPDCFGNVTSSTDAQLGISSDPINQQRDSTHNLIGSDENVHGLSGPNILIPVDNQVDIYVPAYDSGFMQ